MVFFMEVIFWGFIIRCRLFFKFIEDVFWFCFVRVFLGVSLLEWYRVFYFSGEELEGVGEIVSF